MFGSGLNLVSTALGFGMTAAFVAFVCGKFICCRPRRAGSGAPPSLDLDADLDDSVEHTRTGLEPLVIAAIPSMKYNCEAFQSKDDAQCSICLDLWLQKQTTCPICRVSLKELHAAMSSACSIQQLPTVPENSVNPTPQCFPPVGQDHSGQRNSQERNESMEVVIEIRQ
ncbi:unnamed protein product [Urochloa humidicola]